MSTKTLNSLVYGLCKIPQSITVTERTNQSWKKLWKLLHHCELVVKNRKLWWHHFVYVRNRTMVKTTITLAQKNMLIVAKFMATTRNSGKIKHRKLSKFYNLTQVRSLKSFSKTHKKTSKKPVNTSEPLNNQVCHVMHGRSSEFVENKILWILNVEFKRNTHLNNLWFSFRVKYDEAGAMFYYLSRFPQKTTCVVLSSQSRFS